MLEVLELESIVKSIRQEGIEIHNVSTKYNAIAGVMEAQYGHLPLGSKTLQEIQCFFREHQHILDLYQSLCLSSVTVDNSCLS